MHHSVRSRIPLRSTLEGSSESSRCNLRGHKRPTVLVILILDGYSIYVSYTQPRNSLQAAPWSDTMERRHYDLKPGMTLQQTNLLHFKMHVFKALHDGMPIANTATSKQLNCIARRFVYIVWACMGYKHLYQGMTLQDCTLAWNALTEFRQKGAENARSMRDQNFSKLNPRTWETTINNQGSCAHRCRVSVVGLSLHKKKRFWKEVGLGSTNSRHANGWLSTFVGCVQGVNANLHC